MPLYEFENEEHGIRVTLPLPVKGRPDAIVLKRRTVPSRVTVGVGAKPPTHSDKLREGYKKLEEAGGLQERGGNYLPVSTIKRALETPDTE
jgi:hypothetical protein